MASPSAAAAAPAAARVPETLATKVQKHVDSLHAKIAKLTEDNAALKTALQEARSSNSRIRRIPKRPVAGEATQAHA